MLNFHHIVFKDFGHCFRVQRPQLCFFRVTMELTGVLTMALPCLLLPRIVTWRSFTDLLDNLFCNTRLPQWVVV